MKLSFLKLISRLLILSMFGLTLQSAHAGLVGTDQLVAAQQTSSDREKVRNFVSRADVGSQLQAMGINANNAQDRVNAMTDEEVQRIAGKIDSMPAGALSGWGVAIIVALLIWAWYTFAR